MDNPLGGPPNSPRAALLAIRVHCREGTQGNTSQGKAQGAPKHAPAGSSTGALDRLSSPALMCDSAHGSLPTGGLPPWCPVYGGLRSQVATGPSGGRGMPCGPKPAMTCTWTPDGQGTRGPSPSRKPGKGQPSLRPGLNAPSDPAPPGGTADRAAAWTSSPHRATAQGPRPDARRPPRLWIPARVAGGANEPTEQATL